MYNLGAPVVHFGHGNSIIAVDAAALAREDEEPGPPAATVYPTASATRNGGLVGLTGWF